MKATNLDMSENEKIHFWKRISVSSVNYYLLLISVTVVTLIAGHYVDQPNIREVGLEGFLIVLAGIIFAALQKPANLPEIYSPVVKKSIAVAFLIGILFGLADLLVFKIWVLPSSYAELPPFLQPFPYSVLLYTHGAIYTEVINRLIPITLFALLFKWVFPQKQMSYLLVVVIILSFWEPLNQLPDAQTGIIIFSMITGVLFNFLQGYYFLKKGLIVALCIRLGHYLIWHILFGIYVEMYELV